MDTSWQPEGPSSQAGVAIVPRRMLIGAHVSPAGGPAKAVARGEERGCQAIQIFNQSPRMWRPSVYSDEAVAEFREALEASKQVDAVLIHAIYLVNLASEDPDLRAKSLASLTASLQAGDRLGAVGVVVHPGSALKNGGAAKAAIGRAAEGFKEALAESDHCPLHLEDVAGTGGTIGRSFEELVAMIDGAGGGKRLGVCLDSCHMFASGYDVSSAKSLSDVIDDFDRVIGLDRLGSLHVNDSQTPLGSNRDRHANLGDGEIGPAGIAAFLSEPRFDGLPCIFEGPGASGKQVDADDMANAFKLRKRGLKARRR
jgi:deoxyribonuclease-4